MLRSRLLLRAGAIAAVLAGTTLAGCKRSKAPRPCRIDASAVAPRPAWPKPDQWAAFALPQPGNGWISSVAVSADGTAGVYGASIGGAFIPLSEEVTLIRFAIGPELGKDLKPAVMTLPGAAMRNYAALAWSKPGLAWATWSSLGIADPETREVTRLRQIPIPDGQEKRDTFPFHSSVAWAPGGDCVAATVELPDRKAELVTWNADGARAASARHDATPYEKIGAWTDLGVLLVWSSGASPARARWMDPATGDAEPAPAPPEDAQAFSWINGGWLAIDRLGTVTHRVPGEPARLVANVTPALRIAEKEKRKWLRVLTSENGQALIVEESVVAPGKDQRHMHVLTPKAP